jgi:hypothetical protein
MGTWFILVKMKPFLSTISSFIIFTFLSIFLKHMLDTGNYCRTVITICPVFNAYPTTDLLSICSSHVIF